VRSSRSVSKGLGAITPRTHRKTQAPTAVCFLILVVGASREATQRPQRAALEGTWIVTSQSLNGQTSDTGGAEIAITIAGDTYEQSVDGSVDERGTIKVDPTANPMTIDFIITEGMAKDTTQRGIVEITGDAVKFCLNTPGATVRPADFTPLADYMLIFAKKR
jgi:uncharacterized protein (TIGR03067 family)